MDERLQHLHSWLSNHFRSSAFNCQPLAGDASFRRYFRITTPINTWVAMDAPPQQESCQPFIAIAKALQVQGVQVPDIIQHNLTQGFLLLSDFGDEVYLNILRQDNANLLYQDALLTLCKIHSCSVIADWSLPHFDQQLIHKELALFEQWFLLKHLNLAIPSALRHELTKVYELLNQIFAQQPQVCIHRDYHSRNLMRLANHAVGVLDFQDAVWGPISYDAVSLLRDCYITWPTQQVSQWLQDFYHLLKERNLLQHNSLEELTYWFDLTGLQRHLKVLGIFARLHHRDGKATYLQELPRIFNYLFAVCERYPVLTNLQSFLQELALAAGLIFDQRSKIALTTDNLSQAL